MKRAAGVSIVVIFTAMMILYVQAHEYVPMQLQENEILREPAGNIMKKGKSNSFAIPEADGSIPDPFGETAGGYHSSVLSEEERKVLLAYARYLKRYCENYPYKTKGIKFDLVFIDIDNIPELAIIPSDAHASCVTICVYDRGNVVEVGGFGSFGKCRFNPYENLIFSTYMGQGEEDSSFYRIEGTESVELLVLHSVPQYKEDQYVGYCYEVNGTEVSEDVYQQVCEEWDWEELNVWGYEDAVPVKNVDDLYLELCRRFSSVKEQSRQVPDDSCRACSDSGRKGNPAIRE